MATTEATSLNALTTAAHAPAPEAASSNTTAAATTEMTATAATGMTTPGMSPTSTMSCGQHGARNGERAGDDCNR